MVEVLDLGRELAGLASGTPRYTTGRNPSEIRARALEVLSGILEAAGLRKGVLVGAQETLFDLAFDYQGTPVYVEIKFGKVTIRDINRLRAISRGAIHPSAKLLLLCTEMSAEVQNMVQPQSSGSAIAATTFENLKIVIETGRIDEIKKFIEEMSSEPSRAPEVADDQVVGYMKRTFGPGFWSTISKSELAVALLRSTKGILGRADVTIIFVGTTHTGKSTIVNALFGEDVAETREITDVTGQVARIHLQNGLTIIDTPGVGGINEQYEAVTRAYLGLSAESKGKPSQLVSIVDIAPDKTRKESRSRPLEVAQGSVVVVLVFDLGGGFKRADWEFLNEIRERFPSVIVAGNKRDQLTDLAAVERIRLDLKKRAFADFVAIAARPPLAPDRPVAMETLVNAICFQLSENSVSTFNDVLLRRLQIDRQRLVREAILRVAARASTVRPHELIPEVGVPVFKLLLTGLMMRLGIDYAVGGEGVRKEMEEAIRNTFTETVAKSSRRETRVDSHSKQVRQAVTRAPVGAAAGGTAGALIGAIGGPAGMLLGLLLGALLGGAAGASVPLYQMVSEMWNTPEDAITEVPGGAEAAVATIAYGYAVWDAFSRIEEGTAKGIEAKRFARVLAERTTSIRAKLTSSVRRQLDSGLEEEGAYRVLLQLLDAGP